MQENGDGVSSDRRVPASAADTRGKHRILAELKRLEQEARFLEEEVEELERTDRVSAALQEYGQLVSESGKRTRPLTSSNKRTPKCTLGSMV